MAEEEARSAAVAAISARFGLSPEDLKEISAEPSKRPARQDWTFTFADQTRQLPQGEARVAALIAGDEAAHVYRFIHVPEEWEREERSRRNLARIIGILSAVLIALGALAGGVVAVVSWTRRKFSVRTLIWLAPLLFLLNLAGFFNGWPSLQANLTTAQPLSHQLLALIAGGVIGMLLLSLLLALLFGWVKTALHWGGEATARRIALGIALGVVAKALQVLPAALSPATAPAWPEFGALDDFLPVLSPLVASLTQYLTLLAILLLVLAAVDGLTQGWSRRRLAGGLFLLVGLVQQGSSFESLSGWLIQGLLVGIALLLAYFVSRTDIGLIPLALASYLTLGLLQQAVDQAYPGAWLHYGLAAVGPLIAGWLCWKHLDTPDQRGAVSAPSSTQEA